MSNGTTVERGRWYPEMPPALPGETDAQYTDRLTGADGTGRRPYDHPRNRQCSIGWHEECSDPAGERCKCPCHTESEEYDEDYIFGSESSHLRVGQWPGDDRIFVEIGDFDPVSSYLPAADAVAMAKAILERLGESQ